MNAFILSLGYGGRSFDEAVALLSKYKISYVVDVRSFPASKSQPLFKRQTLKNSLRGLGIRYLYLGDKLGGRPKDPTCYVGGRVDYERLKEKGTYKEGISRLVRAHQMGLRICLLCSELRPEKCHRSKLIGNSLEALGIPVEHIDADGDITSQEVVMSRLDSAQLTIFGLRQMSRKTYKATRAVSQNV